MINSPVFEMLKKYGGKKNKRFHMPGHKGKNILFDGMGADIINLDATELDDTDNLLCPERELLLAQQLLAKRAKSKKSFFLCGGSTLGNLTMIMSLVKQNEKILVDRFCHISVFSALTFSGAKPVLLESGYAHKSGVLGAVTRESVEKALTENPDAKAVFVTSPNSFGICAPLGEIAAVCKEKGVYLLVDEAHGAHFPYSSLMPESAMQQGADASVQSYHKTTPALTQSAVLHVGNGDICERVEETLHMLMSTSPSFLLTASIDYARAYMEKTGEKKIKELCEIIDKYSSENVFTVPKMDKLRIVAVCDGEKSIKILRKHGFEPEMYGKGFAVFIVTVADEGEDVRKLLEIIKTLPQNDYVCKNAPCCERVLTPFEVYHKKGEKMSIENAEGRILRKPFYTYPPGAVLIAPGERINKECVSFVIENEYDKSVEVVAEEI